MTENLLRASLAAGRFVHTAELVLGRDHTAAEAETFVREAAASDPGIRIVSLTDLPGGCPALPPDAFVSFAMERGLTPIAHLTGKDANRAFLEARLHGLARMGVESVLALTGDAQKSGGKPVHDLDSVLILDLIESARDGIRYSVGQRALQTTPFDFFAGAVVNPFKVREPDLIMQFCKLRLKIAAGARYIITQVGFDIRKLYELKQYMDREGLSGVPVLANVYVPTAAVARMMQSGELAGCAVADALVRRLEKEKKPERLERAALMTAAARGLGFAGAHIGGFGLTHRDFLTIIERAGAIGGGWRNRMDELVFAYPNQFYLFQEGSDGLSDGGSENRGRAGAFRPAARRWLAGGRAGPVDSSAPRFRPHRPLILRLSQYVHRHLIAEDSFGARFFAARLKQTDGPAPLRKFWAALLAPSSLYRKAALGCVNCGDCIQDRLNYAGCSMGRCYKELRNGPCGGSRTDGTCEARPQLPCLWNLVYLYTLSAAEAPGKFAESIVPPRDWRLDRTNALVNRLAGLDNVSRRKKVDPRQERACS